jgi:DNA-binding response OmpR family regulator
MAAQLLIIDDALQEHKAISILLDELGADIHSAYDGQAGLTMAANIHPDLVLLDVDMPDMSGFEVCLLLKASKATCDIPIIFLTASGSIATKMPGYKPRIADYVQKPLNRALCSRVRVALRTKRLFDLLPALNQSPDDSEPRARSHELNARLSLAQLIRVRALNPWNRRRRCRSNDIARPFATAQFASELCCAR